MNSDSGRVTISEKIYDIPCGQKFPNNDNNVSFGKVVLLGRKKNTLVELRDSINNLIENLPGITISEKKTLSCNISELSDDTVINVSSNLKSVLENAVKIEWENRLQKYINGNPPPPKYEFDKGDRNPIQFLEEVWGKYMDHKVLYQDRLTEYDDKIIKSVYAHWGKYGRAPEDRLPLPKKDRADAILQRVAQGPYTLEEIVRSVRTWDRRAQRSRDIS